jgi:hypothetical protein
MDRVMGMRPSWWLVALAGCAASMPAAGPPSELAGTWQDDYGIRYEITDSTWRQLPTATYLVQQWEGPGQWLVARNAPGNPSDAGRYTRIDWVVLDSMAPWRWAFCLAIWDAPTEEAARQAPVSDRAHPRTGCGGHPFSRMRRADPDSAEGVPGAARRYP